MVVDEGSSSACGDGCEAAMHLEDPLSALKTEVNKAKVSTLQIVSYQGADRR